MSEIEVLSIGVEKGLGGHPFGLYGEGYRNAINEPGSSIDFG
jgi:hypothetical protein